MKPIDVHESISGGHTVARRKAYVPPTCRRLTSAEAKEMLLRRADTSDPEVQRMLKCIEELQRQKVS